MPFNWTCPHCDRAQTVIGTHFDHSRDDIKFTDSANGMMTTVTKAVLCSNPKCQKTTVEVSIKLLEYVNHTRSIVEGVPALYHERVIPRGAAKPQPDYIPAPIVADYVEACLIRELSPKASATLSRRCLQGMIRDFADISKPRLIDEIKALRTAVENGSAPRAVTLESVDAIDHVRKIGNIGAHMERNIDVIIEVDANEASLLINLIELLFAEWYVQRQSRKDRLASITALGETKDQQILDARAEQQFLAPASED